MKNQKDMVSEILEDFKIRQAERKPFEANWQLNINFLLGNQYSVINRNNDIVDTDKQYFWQQREVYNHIAPMIDLRLSKLGKIRPIMNVVPFSDSENDIACAKLSKKLLKAVSYNIDLSNIVAQATNWSEICGTSFYKVSWNNIGGRKISVDEKGAEIFEGEIQVDVVSPFEIYPDSSTYANIEECKSIIHARAYHQNEVERIWGVKVECQDIDVFTLKNIKTLGGLGYQGSTKSLSRVLKKDQVLVLEKYVSPCVDYPNGQLIIIAGDKLVYQGDLPYINKSQDQRGYPFIKQNNITMPNCFWGSSIIERCIPIQRSFNAIKNRKHEFLNRLSMGVLAVEDGSVDIENLEEEGLSPGKILIYRQGSNYPQLMPSGSVPIDFNLEEDRLLNEFSTISGVSDLLSSNNVVNANVSGIALQLLIEQDEARILSTADEIRNAVKNVSKHILRLYKQYAIFPHSTRMIDEKGSIEMFYWKNSDISSEDVIFETDSEINQSLAQKRSMIFEILNAGLLHDQDNKMSNATRIKVLEQLGFGIYEVEHDIKSLQIERAAFENINLKQSNEIDNPLEIDDHQLHIHEHTCYLLSKDFNVKNDKNQSIINSMLEHIKSHKQLLDIQNANSTQITQ